MNNWWVFSEVSKDINYQIFMSETENVDTNELYVLKNLQLMTFIELIKWRNEVGDKIKETALDY